LPQRQAKNISTSIPAVLSSRIWMSKWWKLYAKELLVRLASLPTLHAKNGNASKVQPVISEDFSRFEMPIKAKNIMETFVFVIFIIGYFTGGYYLTKFIRYFLKPFNKYFSLTILSFSYALFFGLGILGSGGDPGFAFPFPIVWAGLVYIWEWSKWTFFINGVMIPFLLWWVLIFVIMVIRLDFKSSYENKLSETS
jgi:hypothetical protein